MSTTTSYKTALTANEIFKAKYNKTMKWALVLSVLFTLIFFLVTPNYVPNPYKLRTKELEITEIDEAVDVPPPPQDIPKPQKAVEAAPDDEVDEDVEIADSLVDADDLVDFSDFNYDDGGDAFVVSQDKPTLTVYSPPDYPEMARASQLEGPVVVKVQVGTDGSVLQAIVIQAVHPMLDREAVKAARRCKFKPGKQRGVPVKAWMAIPYAFRLNT
jgi:periplasmic protein TonB